MTKHSGTPAGCHATNVGKSPLACHSEASC